MVRLLLENGAKIESNDNWSPFKKILGYIFPFVFKIRNLIFTFLFPKVKRKDDPNLLKLFLEFNANPNQRIYQSIRPRKKSGGEKKTYPLIFCMNYKKYQSFQVLLNHQNLQLNLIEKYHFMNVKGVTKDKLTPILFHSIKAGIQYLGSLLKRGINPNLTKESNIRKYLSSSFLFSFSFFFLKILFFKIKKKQRRTRAVQKKR